MVLHRNPQWRRASRLELIALAIYFFLAVALADIFNVRLGVELLTLMVVGAALVITRHPLRFLCEWWFFLIGLVMWNLSGPIAAYSTFPWHLDVLLSLDRALFLGHDPVSAVQQALLTPHITWLDVATSIAYNMHLPEPYIAGYFLWRLNRPLYLQFVSASLWLLVLGFLTFILFPAVPPWMAAEQLVHIHGVYLSSGSWQELHALGIPHPVRYVNAHGVVYLPGVINDFGRVLRWYPMPFHGTPIFYLFQLRGDAVAAFPSEHAAFPMLELLAFTRLGTRAAWLVLLWIAIVAFSVVYLGEHWITDILAGWGYAIVIFAGVRWFAARGSQAGHR